MSDERLVEPADYTPEILASINKIKNRMRNTLVSFTDDDIKVFEYVGIIYILANPILGEEPIFDDFGQFEKMIPMHNITIIYKDWIQSEIVDDKLVFKGYRPRLRILRPDLCDRIF